MKEQIDIFDDLLIEFDEMGFVPTTAVPDHEAYAIDWKNRLINALEGYRKQSEKYLIKENGDIFPLKHHSEWISVEDMVDAPTADVVEVVRCKDCKWWHGGKIDQITNYHYGCCDRPLGEYYECDSNFNTTSNDFCSCGERKE